MKDLFEISGLRVLAPSSDEKGVREVSRPVDVGVYPGQLTLLAGRNGSGKSSVLYSVAGVPGKAIVEGDVRIGSEQLSLLDIGQRLPLWFVTSGINCFRRLSVWDNVAVTQLVQQGRIEVPAVEATIDRWNLLRLRKRRSGTLSGGERRRLELAMAEIANPRVVLLDEPIAGLDKSSIQTFVECIEAFLQRGAAVLLAEHLVSAFEKLNPNIVRLVKQR